MAGRTREGIGVKGSRKAPHKMQNPMLKKEQCFADKRGWSSAQKKPNIQRSRILRRRES